MYTVDDIYSTQYNHVENACRIREQICVHNLPTTDSSNMTFQFVNQPLRFGLYEPEGLYLHCPLAGHPKIAQYWGENSDYYAQFSYHGVPLKGHPGLDLLASVGSMVLAVDRGRVVEISMEPNGFERYLKLEHAWGESLYAHLNEVEVETGQLVNRGAQLALSGDNEGALQPHLHFAIRVTPYNRFDGWGGFADPLPFFSAADLQPADEGFASETQLFSPPPMATERAGMRRP